MKPALRIPTAIACTVILGTGLYAAVACGGGESPPQEAGMEGMEAGPGPGGCDAFCVPDGTDAGVCPEPAFCADGAGCPPGCTPVG